MAVWEKYLTSPNTFGCLDLHYKLNVSDWGDRQIDSHKGDWPLWSEGAILLQCCSRQMFLQSFVLTSKINLYKVLWHCNATNGWLVGWQNSPKIEVGAKDKELPKGSCGYLLASMDTCSRSHDYECSGWLACTKQCMMWTVVVVLPQILTSVWSELGPEKKNQFCVIQDIFFYWCSFDTLDGSNMMDNCLKYFICCTLSICSIARSDS